MTHVLDKDALPKMTYVKDTFAIKMDRIESKKERMMTLIKGLVKFVEGMKYDLERPKEKAEIYVEEASEEEEEGEGVEFTYSFEVLLT